MTVTVPAGVLVRPGDAIVGDQDGVASHWRDCHFADALSIPVETSTRGRGEGEGGQQDDSLADG